MTTIIGHLRSGQNQSNGVPTDRNHEDANGIEAYLPFKKAWNDWIDVVNGDDIDPRTKKVYKGAKNRVRIDHTSDKEFKVLCALPALHRAHEASILAAQTLDTAGKYVSGPTLRDNAIGYQNRNGVSITSYGIISVVTYLTKYLCPGATVSASVLTTDFAERHFFGVKCGAGETTVQSVNRADVRGSFVTGQRMYHFIMTGSRRSRQRRKSNGNTGRAEEGVMVGRLHGGPAKRRKSAYNSEKVCASMFGM